MPDLERSLVQKRGIVTVPHEDAVVNCDCALRRPCDGLSLFDLPLSARTLELYLREMGNRFVSRMRVRGLEWVGGDLRLHGPWVSYDFNEKLADVESNAWKQAVREDDPSGALPFVFERDASCPYSDYLLVGEFIVKNTWTEVIVPESTV
jgi:hypothetical protein